jgi:hypothetical protein
MNNKIVCIIVVEFCIDKTRIIPKNGLVQYNTHTMYEYYNNIIYH